MGRLSFGDKDEEEYDNRLIARGKVMATLKSLEVLGFSEKRFWERL